MADEDRTELALNFGADNGQTEELEAVRGELAEELAAETPEVAQEISPEIAPEATPDSTAEPEKPASSRIQYSFVMNVPRSQQPVNHPAGTPPLENKPLPPPVSGTISNGSSYGSVLRSLRESRGLTFKDLEDATQISARYLENIENEVLDGLPPLVYVIAYIRTLSRFYQLETSVQDQLVAKLKSQLEYSCTNEIIGSLELDNSNAQVNEKRMRKIMLCIGSAAALVVVLIGLTIYFCLRTPAPEAPKTVTPQVAEQRPASGQEFNPKKMYLLLEPPTLDLPKLPVAE